NINIAFELVKSHKMKLFDMRKRERSKFSIKNRKLTRKRNEYLISLRLRVKSYLLSPIPAERGAAKQIHFVMKPYGRGYYVASILPQTRFAEDLEQKLKHKKSFREAILLLGLNDLLNTIINMTVEIMANYKHRVNENAETKNKREGVKKAAYRDMKIMADAINFATAVNQHSEDKIAVIEVLIYYIDGILRDFRTTMKSRNTKRKNREAVAAAVKQLISIQQEQPKLLPMGNGGW
ncbi:MAG TPA: DUF6261 family protein, partial [Dysgonamonadaceae bacterium]|nr:DUF6261 family protein [Dysgonamonadaceae bacterium]